ncbi:glycosyl transferase family 2 [Vibrio cholerae]|uniref:glycosyltransferase family 2 protein n=2 Tax=Vibrio cholerae TaxID=666 RepID=UPI000BA9AB88|nr:glycosyltransferase [Vibrio cholerae]MCD6670082.1 glycosyltransferase [Vibrio cholerae]PAS04602.1 glycosyl transferase 2 family protein [Vibrio cholerae]BCN19202.1 putative glycosyltransferase [Vibrio cholerae]BCN19950.1 putative glycosyltransferase [Vibrio cholerae]GHY71474.1 glycosyl transferase family 2 [Vibrio cholerae]
MENSEKYNPKVSVMIVTYNQEDLISETIDSVLNQDYPNLEIVIADDASTDNTPKIIQGYYERYPKIIVPIFNDKNLGITGNSNASFFACTGEYIALLGGDDIFLPGKISKQIEAFSDPDVVLSYHPVDVFLHQTGETLFITNQTGKERINNVYDIISKGGIPGASSIMVRASACPCHGFDPMFPVVSDWIFSIETAYKGKVVEIPELLGRYRKHGRGASERTFELLEESLLTLSTIQERYPNDEKLFEACREGRYRYLCGEMFRQLSKKNHERFKLLVEKVDKDIPDSKKVQWLIISKLINYPMVFNASSIFLPKVKNLIKRFS